LRGWQTGYDFSRGCQNHPRDRPGIGLGRGSFVRITASSFNHLAKVRVLSTAPRLKFLRNLQQLTDRQGDLDALSLQRALQMGFRLPRPKTLRTAAISRQVIPADVRDDRAALYGPFPSPDPLRRSSRSMSSACLAAGIYASVGAHDRAGPGRPTTEDKANEGDLSGCGSCSLGSSGERQGRPVRPAMAFHGPQRRHAPGYPPLVRAPHPAMGDVCTQGHSLEGLMDHQMMAEAAAQRGAIVPDANV
jgi:hypothetical protein